MAFVILTRPWTYPTRANSPRCCTRGPKQLLSHLRQELERLQKQNPTSFPQHKLPTSAVLREHGRRDLDNMIGRLGGYPKVRELLQWECKSGRRSKGYWKEFGKVEIALRKLIKENEMRKFPTQKELRNLGRSDLIQAMELHGGMKKVAERMKMDSGVKKRGYWKEWRNVRDELQRFVEMRDGERKGRMTKMVKLGELRKAGRTDLETAIVKHHGGVEQVAKRMGWKTRDKVQDGFDWVAKQIYELVGDGGEMPKQGYLRRNGRTDLAQQVTKWGGPKVVAERLDLVYQGRQRDRLDEWGIFRLEMMEFMKKHGHEDEIPSNRLLSNFGREDLYLGALHHGGLNSVADRLGLKRSYWSDFSNVGKELVKFIEVHGTCGVMPTSNECSIVGRRSLALAIDKFGREQIAHRLGLQLTRDGEENALRALLQQSLE